MVTFHSWAIAGSIAGSIAVGAAGLAQASTASFDAVVGAEIQINLDPYDPLYQRNFPNRVPDFSGLVFERSFQSETPLQAISTGSVSVDTEIATAADITALNASVRADVSGAARDGATISIPEFDATAGFIVENTSSEVRSFLAQVETETDYSVRRSTARDTAVVDVRGALLDPDTGEPFAITGAGSFYLRPGREELLYERAFTNSLGYNFIFNPGDRFFVGVGVRGEAEIGTTEASVSPVPLPAGASLLAAGLLCLGFLRRRQSRGD